MLLYKEQEEQKLHAILGYPFRYFCFLFYLEFQLFRGSLPLSPAFDLLLTPQKMELAILNYVSGRENSNEADAQLRISKLYLTQPLGVLCNLIFLYQCWFSSCGYKMNVF